MVDRARGVAGDGFRASPKRKNCRKFNGLSLARSRTKLAWAASSSGASFVASENVSVAGLAGRYATALFELATEAKALDAIASDLSRLKALVDGSADLARLVRSPIFSREEQGKAMDAVLARLNVNPLTKNFVGLLAQKRRLFALTGIVAAFDKLVANQRGEMTVEVTSAQALKSEQRTALMGTLKDAMKREMRLTERVDPTLLGGLIVKVGSRQIDSTLKSKLVRLERAMRGA
jgi:F-type H+-transporting ATPase subunit delta